MKMKNKLLFLLAMKGLTIFSFIDAKELLPSSSKIAPIESDEEESVVMFTPPPNWRMADPSSLSRLVKVMVVGEAKSHFRPSMNLCCEPYQGTLQQYLKKIKDKNASEGYEWKNLGNIHTEAGNANLSQVDTKTQWGELRMMHVVLLKNGYIYILTASALKNEFSIYYKDFFASMRSLRIARDLYEMIPSPQQRTQLKTIVQDLKTQWLAIVKEKQGQYPEMSLKEIQENVFNDNPFKQSHWVAFEQTLKQKYSHLSTEWHTLFLQRLEDQLFNMKPLL